MIETGFNTNPLRQTMPVGGVNHDDDDEGFELASLPPSSRRGSRPGNQTSADGRPTGAGQQDGRPSLTVSVSRFTGGSPGGVKQAGNQP